MDPNNQQPKTDNESTQPQPSQPTQSVSPEVPAQPRQDDNAGTLNPNPTMTIPSSGSTQAQPGLNVNSATIGKSAKKHSLVRILIIVIVAITLLGAGYLVYESLTSDDEANQSQTSNNNQSSSQDNQSQISYNDADRRLVLNTAHADLEKYYNEFGVYPTQNEVTSSSFQSANMNETLQAIANQTDITGISETLNEKTVQYTPSPSGCDNESTDCTSYTLNVKLSNSTYTKNSLN